MDYQPTSLQTIIFLSLFLIGYLFVLLKNAHKYKIDLYDLLLLLTVAVIPSIFAFFPKFSQQLAQLFGVLFPFVVLFGALFFIVFVYLYRLVIKINSQNQNIIMLTQELSLLRQKMQQDVNCEEKASDK